MTLLDDVQPRRHALELVPPLSPPPTVGDPPQQLREMMGWCRSQRMLFDAAWESCLGTVAFPASLREEREWRKMLEATREGWRAAYDGWPPLPTEVAVGTLADVFAALADAAHST